MNTQVFQVLKFMQINLGKTISIDEMAHLVHLSRSRLHYLFKTDLGVAPRQYLKALRIQRACHLLEATLLGVREIALEVGYKDDSHFMRDFKKVRGVTPSQYRSNFLEPE